jgi:uncharacterized protein DUF2283
MAEKLTLSYDSIGDILYIKKCAPYAEEESDLLDDDVVARYNPTTGGLESLEILFFTKRLRKPKAVEVPLDLFQSAAK